MWKGNLMEKKPRKSSCRASSRPPELLLNLDSYLFTKQKSVVLRHLLKQYTSILPLLSILTVLFSPLPFVRVDVSPTKNVTTSKLFRRRLEQPGFSRLMKIKKPRLR